MTNEGVTFFESFLLSNRKTLEKAQKFSKEISWMAHWKQPTSLSHSPLSPLKKSRDLHAFCKDFSSFYLCLNQNARGKKPKLLFFPLFTASETFFSNHPLAEVLRMYLFTVLKKQIKKKIIVNKSTIIC